MALTQVSSLGISLTAWQRIAYFALRPELYYDSLVVAAGATHSLDFAGIESSQIALVNLGRLHVKRDVNPDRTTAAMRRQVHGFF